MTASVAVEYGQAFVADAQIDEVEFERLSQ